MAHWPDEFRRQNVRFVLAIRVGRAQRATGRGYAGTNSARQLARKLLPHLFRRNLDLWRGTTDSDHRSIGGRDARATAQVLLHMLADARRLDVDTWEQLTPSSKPKPAPVRSALHSGVVENIA